MRTAVVWIALTACGSQVDVERDHATASSSRATTSSTSSTSGATGGQGGAGGAPGLGGQGGNPGCPADTQPGEPCAVERLFCPSSSSCSGYLMCLDGEWTLVNPC